MVTKNWQKIRGEDKWESKMDTKGVIEIQKLDGRWMVSTTSFGIKDYPRNKQGKYYGNVFRTKKDALLQVRRIMRIN